MPGPAQPAGGARALDDSLNLGQIMPHEAAAPCAERAGNENGVDIAAAGEGHESG